MGLTERLAQAGSGPGRPSIPAGIQAAVSRRLDETGLVKRDVHAYLMQSLGQRLYGGQLERRALEAYVFDAIQHVMDAQDRPLSGGERTHLVQEVIDDILGNGPLEPLLRDPEITEIMVNRFDLIFIEKEGNIHPTDLRFTGERHLREIIDRIVSRVGRRVDESSPMVDARLPDGSRVNAVVPPIAIDGASLTIRKFSKEPFSARDLIAFGTLTPVAVEVLNACVRGRLNVLISGGTGSGKTTTLDVLSSFIPHNERIITIEDAAELRLSQPQVVRMEARPPNAEGRGEVTIRDLVRNSLRMRPDRIIVGEVRDAAALDMLQAMNTGHDGSLSTVHANSPRDALSRVEIMVMMAGLDLPVNVIRAQAVSALDLIVQQQRLRDGSRHITQITEIIGMEGKRVLMQDLFTFEYGHQPAGEFLGQLVATGLPPHFKDRLQDRGVDLRKEWFRK